MSKALQVLILLAIFAVAALGKTPAQPPNCLITKRFLTLGGQPDKYATVTVFSIRVGGTGNPGYTTGRLVLRTDADGDLLGIDGTEGWAAPQGAIVQIYSGANTQLPMLAANPNSGTQYQVPNKNAANLDELIWNLASIKEKGALLIGGVNGIASQFTPCPDGQTIIWEAAQTLGARCGVPGAVLSVFGRTGAVVAQSGDYAAHYAALSHTHPATQISDSTSAGRTLLTAADAAAQRTALGLAAVASSGSASDLGAGILPDGRFPPTLPAISGANLTNLSASNLASGTVPTARLGSGTANSTTYLRGDNTWATGSGGATTALDNLASVSINTALLAQTAVDLGSTTNPFRDLYLSGAGTYGTNYFRFTGTPTAARTVTIPDDSITVARTDAAQTFRGAQTFDTIPIITNSAPGLVFTDTTASAKSLTVAVDANLAQFRESAGASGSLLVLDLINSRLGVGTATPGAAMDVVAAAQSGVAETLFRLRDSDDATAQVEIFSNTSTDGVFAPAIRATASRNVDYGISLIGQVASGLDTGVTPLVAVVGQRSGGDALTSRHLFGVFNATTAYLRLDATGNLAVGSGNILGRIAARGTTTDASANALWLEDSAGTGQFVVRNNGLTGVGSNSPAAQIDVRPISSSTVGQIVRLASGQTANALNIENSTGTFLSGFLASGALRVVSLADGAAPTNSIYYSTTASKLVFKDAGGTVNALY